VLREADPDDTVARGTRGAAAPVVLSVLPSGACLPIEMDASAGAWDPVGCRPAAALPSSR
jgi:hypothetical protein